MLRHTLPGPFAAPYCLLPVRCPVALLSRLDACAQVIEQHEAAAGARGGGADLLGFATAPARRRNEAKARCLLACWMAETGQGYFGDIQSESCAFCNIGDNGCKVHCILICWLAETGQATAASSTVRFHFKGV